MEIKIIECCWPAQTICTELPRSPSCTWPRTNRPPFFSWLTNRMSWQDERGLATISSTCGLQNFTWSFLTSSMSRYLRTYGQEEVTRDDNNDKNRPQTDVCDGVSEGYLMEDQSLADVAPAAGGRSEVEEEQKQQQEDDAAGGVHRVDHKHHH